MELGGRGELEENFFMQKIQLLAGGTISTSIVCWVLLSFQALAQLADGSVASGVGVMVKVTINNDVTTLFEDELLSGNEEGAVSLDIAVPAHAKCMKISVSTCTLLYRIFALLSACAYIPTGRKPAFNSEVRLIVRCVWIEMAVSKYTCAHVVSTCSIKGCGQILARVIICITACHPAKKGAYFLKSVTIEHRHSNFD